MELKYIIIILSIILFLHMVFKSFKTIPNDVEYLKNKRGKRKNKRFRERFSNTRKNHNDDGDDNDDMNITEPFYDSDDEWEENVDGMIGEYVNYGRLEIGETKDENTEDIDQYRDRFIDFRNNIEASSNEEDMVDRMNKMKLQNEEDMRKGNQGKNLSDIFNNLTVGYKEMYPSVTSLDNTPQYTNYDNRISQGYEIPNVSNYQSPNNGNYGNEYVSNYENFQ